MTRPPLHPAIAYERIMGTIHDRFIAIESVPRGQSVLLRAEDLAKNVRKIVEGVAYCALSAVEYRNGKSLLEQRTKDADKAPQDSLSLCQAATAHTMWA